MRRHHVALTYDPTEEEHPLVAETCTSHFCFKLCFKLLEFIDNEGVKRNEHRVKSLGFLVLSCFALCANFNIFFIVCRLLVIPSHFFRKMPLLEPAFRKDWLVI